MSDGFSVSPRRHRDRRTGSPSQLTRRHPPRPGVSVPSSLPSHVWNDLRRGIGLSASISSCGLVLGGAMLGLGGLSSGLGRLLQGDRTVQLILG